MCVYIYIYIYIYIYFVARGSEGSHYSQPRTLKAAMLSAKLGQTTRCGLRMRAVLSGGCQAQC